MNTTNQQPVVHRRHSRLAASMLKSLFLFAHCLSSTIQTIQVLLLAKAVGFTIAEFSTRNKKKFTLYRELLIKVVFRNLSAEFVLYWNSSYNSILVKLLPETFKMSHDTIVQLIFDKPAKSATSRSSASLRAATRG
jgi:hypothetical protein